MRRQIPILYVIAMIFLSCSNTETNLFLSDEFVDLKGKASLTIIKNATPDTLRLAGTFFNYLPYVENPFIIKIAPNQQDTLKFNFTYPDFIFIHEPSYFKLYNAPGKIVKCEISTLTPTLAHIAFHGEFSDINKFYLAYHNQMGSRLEENRTYYEISDRITDFNRFPAIVDSINQLSIDFIRSYNGQLPDWFKKHEEWRQKYNGAFVKDQALVTKEFYGGKPVPVSDSYFLFYNEIPFENREMVMNTEYLLYIISFEGWVTHKKLQKQKRNLSASRLQFDVIDSLFNVGVVGDILRMHRLPWIYKDGYQPQYDSLMNRITFGDDWKKQILDSLVKLKCSRPILRKTVPELSMKDLNGKEFSFADFRETNVIINFWAVWCGPCRKEFPYENKLYNEYKDKGLTVINICVDSEMNQWKAVSKDRDLQMINLFTDQDEYKRICKVFGIFGLPKSILLDKNLLVVDNNFKRASLLTEGEIKQIIN